MVMFSEVRECHNRMDELSDSERLSIPAKIIEGFRKKGRLPGAYRPIWSIYERSVGLYRKRKAALGWSARRQEMTSPRGVYVPPAARF